MDTFSISNTISKGSVLESNSIYAAYQSDAASRIAGDVPEAISNERIRKGDVILETYTVRSDAILGGMGSVWRVHHGRWNADLAMKRPQPRFFAEGSERRKAEFIAECDHWINLGLHPNIVPCYYVRDIGGVPTIFSEWMDGGSLKDAIRTGRLYEGSEAEVQERILDVAIQAARGLRYSHEQGLIHQDVKPGNLLLSPDWEVKVADFGLATAYSALDRDEGAGYGSGGYTPEYCPREQSEGGEAAPWMDAYALALTLVEMYAGRRLWETGAEAFPRIVEALDAPEPPFRAKVPARLADALREESASGGGRLRDVQRMEALLRDAYREVAGSPYPRKAAGSLEQSAGVLNNMALSYIDLGDPDSARGYFREALERDPMHPDAVYNDGLYRWRRGLITDDEAIAEVRKLWDLRPSTEAAMYLARLELEREEPGCALAALEKAEPTEDVRALIREAEAARAEAEARVRPPLAEELWQDEVASRRQDAVWVADEQNGARLVGADGTVLRRLPQLRRIDAASEDDRLVAAFEKTGERIRRGCSDPEYRCNVYDAATGEQVCSVDKGLGDISCEVFFLDGGRLLAIHGVAEYEAGYDEAHDEDLYEKTTDEDVRVYDMETGEKLYALPWTFKRQCFTAGGRWLAATFQIWENDDEVRRPLCLYDAYTGEEIKELEQDTRRHLIDLAFFSADADELFTLGRDGYMNAYSVPEGRRTRHKRVHNPDFESKKLLVAGDGRLVTGDRNGRFRFWGEDGRCVRSGPNGKEPWNAAPSRLAPSGKSWFGRNGRALRAWPFPENSHAAHYALSRVRSVREMLDAAGRFRLQMEEAMEARIAGRYAEAYEMCLKARELPGYENAREAMELCRDLGAHGTRTTLRLVRRRAEYAPKTNYSVGSLAFGKGGQYLLFNLGGAACRLDICRDALVRGFHTRPQDEQYRNIAVVPSTGQLFCQTDRGACLVRPGNGSVERKLDRRLAAPKEKTYGGACAVSRDGRYAAVLTRAEAGLLKKRRFNVVYLWDLEKDRKVCAWEMEQEVGALLFSEKGEMLYAAAAVGLWALKWSGGAPSAEKLPIHFSVGEGPWEMGMELSSDGKYLLVHGYMGDVCIDLSEGTARDAGRRLWTRGAAFVPFSHLYFCACKDGLITLQAPGEEPAFRFQEDGMPDQSRHTRLAVSPEGDMLAVVTKQNGVALYDLEWNYVFS